MAAIREFFQNLFYALPKIGILDIADILIVALLIYTVISFIRSTSAARIFGCVVVLVLATIITGAVKMYTVNWILNKILELGFIALVIVFQPELRRAMEKVGGKLTLNLSGSSVNRSEMESAISATVQACEIMAKERVGVLLVFEREDLLDSYCKSGTLVDAKLTEQLLRNLFFPKASLHDGAVIVRGGRIAAAGCVMPLSQNPHLSPDLGTRHRAGVGTSEESDAVVVIVSEETGAISVAIGGMLKRHLAPQTLEKLLKAELIAQEESGSVLRRIQSRIGKKEENNENQ